jgi:ribosomal protein L7/L12
MDHYLPLEIVVPLLLVWVIWSMTRNLETRLRNVERTTSALARHFNIDPTAEAAPSDRVKLLATDPARKIEAMRLYRQETGADLKTAKTVVDNLAREN